jgi:hypothetical protein
VWISLRVGVGLDRMGRDADAERRRDVVDLGFGFNESGFLDSALECEEDRETLPEVKKRLFNCPK